MNLICARAAALLKKGNFFFILFGCFLLSACASSNVSRDAAANFDLGAQNARGLYDNASNTDIGESYQNASQATKGAILGGAAGAVTGVLTSGISIIPVTATGLVLGASYGSYIDSNTSLEDKLENTITPQGE